MPHDEKMHLHHPKNNINNFNLNNFDNNSSPSNHCCPEKKGEKRKEEEEKIITFNMSSNNNNNNRRRKLSGSSAEQKQQLPRLHVRRRRRRRLQPNLVVEADVGDVGVWMDGLILKEPWQYNSNEDWEVIMNEVQHFVTGILFLLVVRRILVHRLRIRYRSDSSID
jgi:hypothetical protein